MTDYVLGFLFSSDFTRVALIQKQKPDWQKGLWNGIGGKIEPGESPEAAMRREFLEETGVDIDSWSLFDTIVGKAYRLYCFRAVSDRIDECHTTTDEVVMIAMTTRVSGPSFINNLSWLVPKAMWEPSTSITYQ